MTAVRLCSGCRTDARLMSRARRSRAQTICWPGPSAKALCYVGEEQEMAEL